MSNTALMLDLGEIVAVVLLVLGNGFFVAAEFALVRIRETQLEPLVNRGDRRAKLARHIVRNLNAYLSATQLGITMASLGLGWVGEPVFTSLLTPLLTWLGVESEALRHSLSFAVGFTALTFLHITIGELAPKWSAIKRALPIALTVAHPLHWFYLALYPFNWLLNHAAGWLLGLLGVRAFGEGEGEAHSEEELRVIVAASQQHFGASHFSRDLVQNALALRHRIAREVMRPRQEITVLDTTASIAECLDVAERTRFSRFPLCETGNLDRMVGAIHIKDLYAMRIKARSGADLLPLAKKLIYVPETSRLEKLLQLFLERKLHMAIVVDEYGGTMGLVTIENILEEVVGPIQDEFDQEKPLLIRAGENEWDVDGALPLHDLEGLVGESLAAEGITTTNGFVTSRLGGFAKPGDAIVIGAFELRVEEVDGMRVAKLKLARKAALPEA